MMLIRTLLWNVLFLLLPLAGLCAEKSFEYSEQARNAYQYAISLRPEEARTALRNLKSREPNNLIAYHIENYLDFLQLYLSEDEALYARLKKNEEIRIRKIQEGNENSPYFQFVQADIRLQWSLLKFHFGDYFSAFMDISKAYKLLRRNQEKYPAFLPNLKGLGILHALVGTIPDNYRWGARLLGGMTGTIDQGKSELEKVLKAAQTQEFLFEEETLILYSFVLVNLSNEPEKAWKTILQSGLTPSKDPLHCYISANVAMQSAHNDEAIRILEQRPTGPEFQDFPLLDFMWGTAKLRKLDPGASRQFQDFLGKFKGRNGIKAAYQKLAWCALLRNDPDEYKRFLQYALTRGAAESGADKNALKEAQVLQPTPLNLLKARLLFDGGYFQQALQALQSPSPDRPQPPEYQQEYYYRKGRILHGMKRYSEAIPSYQKSIELGKNTPFYFACNAALQTGLIYEETGKTELAKSYFRTCLSLNPEDYRTSLHQSAKAGLNRLQDSRK